jgi:hypothetical protein
VKYKAMPAFVSALCLMLSIALPLSAQTAATGALDRSILSPDSGTNERSPEVSSTAFRAPTARSTYERP